MGDGQAPERSEVYRHGNARMGRAGAIAFKIGV
jgi:hypothetical protein